MEQLIILLIFGAIAVGNHLLKKSVEKADPPVDDSRKTAGPPRINRPAAPSVESDEERMRRFMEALGVPPASPPPRRVASPGPPVQPWRPSERQTPASKSSALPPVRRRRPVSPTPPPMVQPMPALAVQPLPEPSGSFPEPVSSTGLAPVEAMSTGVPMPPKTEVEVSNLPGKIQAMLRNRDSLRAAIILREIFDVPRGLESYKFRS